MRQEAREEQENKVGSELINLRYDSAGIIINGVIPVFPFSSAGMGNKVNQSKHANVFMKSDVSVRIVCQCLQNALHGFSCHVSHLCFGSDPDL